MGLDGGKENGNWKREANWVMRFWMGDGRWLVVVYGGRRSVGVM